MVQKTDQWFKKLTNIKMRGQGLVEYVALTALVAIVCVGTVKIFGARVTRHLNSVSTRFDNTIRTGLNARAANPNNPAND